MIETRSPSSPLSTSMTSDTCSRNAPKIGKFAHRPDEFFQIVEAARRVRRALRLPHVDIAAFLQNELRQLFMRDLLGLPPPPIEVVEEASQDLTRARFHFLGFDKRPRGAR